MLSQENENFICFFLLELKGGREVLRLILESCLRKEGKTIDELLVSNEVQDKLLRSHRVTIPMREALFPVVPKTRNVSEWDIALLSFIILEYLGKHLNPLEKQGVEQIRDFRNKMSHKPEPVIDPKTFKNWWTDLVIIITTLSHGTSSEDYLKNLIRSISNVELDLGVALGEVKSLLLKSSEDIGSMLRITEQLEKLQLEANVKLEELHQKMSDLSSKHDRLSSQNEAILQKMIELGKQYQEMQYTLKIVANVNADNVGGKESAEKCLFEASKARLEKKTSEDNLHTVRAYVDDLVDDIEKDGNRLTDVSEGSVIFEFKCSSLESMLQLIDFVFGFMIQKHLKNIERSLEDIVGEKINVDLYIPREQFNSLLISLGEKTHDRSVKYTVSCNGIKGVEHILDLFDNGAACNSLNKLATALSDVVGEPVRLETSVDLQDIKDDIMKTQDTTQLVSTSESGVIESDLEQTNYQSSEESDDYQYCCSEESDYFTFESSESSEESDDSGNVDSADEDMKIEDESKENNSMASDYEVSDDEKDETLEMKQRSDDTKAEKTEFVLRSYQLELAENALLGRNTIICSATGSGKTWVALHVIKEHLQKASSGPKKVMFMARTSSLVKHQFQRFQKYLPQFNSKLLTVDGYDSRMLNVFLEQECDIFCLTPQILVHYLDSNTTYSLCEFSMLVLDECHRTQGDEPYNRLMRRYLIEKQREAKRLPQVVGLTAFIGVGMSRTEEEAMDYILRVCARLDVEVISTVERNIVELRKFTHMPVEETKPLQRLVNDPCKNIIIKAMEVTEEMLQDNAFLQPELMELILDKHPRNKESQEYSKWTIEVMKQAEMKVDNQEISRDISTSAKYLNIYHSALEINTLLPTRDVIKYLAEKHRLESENTDRLRVIETKLFRKLQDVQMGIYQKARNVKNPNVRILRNALKKMLEEKGEDSRVIVFVGTRATCKYLAAYLDKDFETIPVRASPLYGKDKRGGDDGMSEREQMDILDKFRVGIFKILVCPFSGSEGFDVPYCNIVICCECPADEITKIQMKGRARNVMGSAALVEQDRNNVFKADLMNKALAKVKQLDPKVVRMKIAMFQKKDLIMHKWKGDIERMKKSRKNEVDYMILCRRCNTVACYASDVRKMGHDYIVIDRSFADRIIRKPHAKPKMYNGLFKLYKMFCQKCPLDWGIIGTRNGLDCMILKIISFKFLNLRTNGIETYKKWIDVPYNVPEITPEDLPGLIGEAMSDDQT